MIVNTQKFYVFDVASGKKGRGQKMSADGEGFKKRCFAKNDSPQIF